ncbi:unnamed protein product [Mesocestoides corti]|uniref:DNA-directed RNA polymerase I subunit RPA49 n=2 Tax=Mesocestoides corti TaxID=53468 RepID=A0A3P6GW96_MESCO|nr:unnamed protein product [Mesocestoides corti]
MFFSFVTVVYNKKTKGVQISYNLPEFLVPSFDVEGIDEDNSRTLEVTRDSLTQAFGSAKSKKLIKAADQMAAHSSAVNDASVLQRVAHGQSVLTKNNQNSDSKLSFNGDASASQREQLLPSFDQNTRCVSHVFPIGKIVSSVVSESLASEAKALSEADDAVRKLWVTEKKYPHFIIDRLIYLPVDNESNSISTPVVKKRRKSDKSEKPVSRMQMATNLALLAHMFRLYQLKPRELQQRTPLNNTPLPVSKHLLSEFTILTTKEGNERTKIRTMTPTLRDKLIYHILVLLLHCDNFATVVDNLSIDFKLSTLRLKNYYSFIGCNFAKRDLEVSDSTTEGEKHQHTVARLSAPLAFKSTRIFKR